MIRCSSGSLVRAALCCLLIMLTMTPRNAARRDQAIAAVALLVLMRLGPPANTLKWRRDMFSTWRILFWDTKPLEQKCTHVMHAAFRLSLCCLQADLDVPPSSPFSKVRTQSCTPCYSHPMRRYVPLVNLLRRVCCITRSQSIKYGCTLRISWRPWFKHTL